MIVAIEYNPTAENMEHAFQLQIDIVQRLSKQDSLHLIAEKEPTTTIRNEDVFEIRIGGSVVFDKQSIGRLPNGEEVVDYIINNS